MRTSGVGSDEAAESDADATTWQGLSVSPQLGPVRPGTERDDSHDTTDNASRVPNIQHETAMIGPRRVNLKRKRSKKKTKIGPESEVIEYSEDVWRRIMVFLHNRQVVTTTTNPIS